MRDEGWLLSVNSENNIWMNTDADAVAHRLTRLESQARRLRITTYLVWPAVWLASIALAFLPSRLDENAMRVFLRWIQEGFVTVASVLFVTLALFFLLKVASDFRKRRSKFALNPGSRKPTLEEG